MKIAELLTTAVLKKIQNRALLNGPEIKKGLDNVH